MARFRYQALDSDERPVTGELEAESVRQAIADLEAAGLKVQSIGFATAESATSIEGIAGPPRAPRGKAVEADRAAMRAHLGRLLAAGAALVPALDAYAEEIPSRRRRRELETLARVLERGNVAEAEQALTAMPQYWIPLLSAATSGDPALVLRRFLDESQQADELRRQWWLALAYPLAVACLAAAVLFTISILIIPGFREIFLDFGLQLPALTSLILSVSQWINNGRNLLVVATVLALLALAFYVMRISSNGRFRVPSSRATEIAKLTRFTADLLEAGLPTPEALRLACASTSRRRVRRAAVAVAEEIESGHRTAPDADKHPLTFTVLHAMRAEMPSGSRVRLLKEISQAHVERAQARLSWTRGIVEPVAIIVIGLLVGIIVMALFLPLISLVEGLAM